MLSKASSISSLLGFAKKSGKLLIGESAADSAIKRKAAQLIMLAEDLPEKRKLRWTRRCEALGIRTLVIGTKKELGEILGMSERAILVVTDRQMSAAIRDKIEPDK